jgi:CBS domain-containing protein
VRPETPLMTAVGLLRRHRIGSLPVVKNKKLVGIITRSDILDFVLRGEKNNGGKAAKPSAKPEPAGKSKKAQPK